MSALDDQIEWHRAEYRNDVRVEKLVSSQPPTTMDLNTGALFQEPAAAIGMTISGPLLRRIGHPEGFGSHHPWSSGLWRLRHHCRRNHPYHRAADRPYWRGSLCHQLVVFTILRGYTLVEAAGILRYDSPDAVLREALTFIEDTIDDFRAKAEKRERELQGHGPGAVPAYRVEQRHDQPGLHQQDCPQCRKSNAA